MRKKTYYPHATRVQVQRMTQHQELVVSSTVN